MRKYNLSKIYDDSFKKGILDIIKQGMPEGAIYSSKVKPPEGAQVYRTDRGTEYWIPSKKDEPKQAKPKVSSTPKAVDMTPEKAQDLLSTFDENEDKNYHSENAKLLADNFGTPEQQKKMNEILDRHQKSSTGISDEDYNWRNKNINPLYQKLVEASKPKQAKPMKDLGKYGPYIGDSIDKTYKISATDFKKKYNPTKIATNELGDWFEHPIYGDEAGLLLVPNGTDGVHLTEWVDVPNFE